MTPQERLVTVAEGADEEEVVSLLHQHRIEKVLVVGDNFELKGMITAKGLPESQGLPPSLQRRDRRAARCCGRRHGI